MRLRSWAPLIVVAALTAGCTPGVAPSPAPTDTPTPPATATPSPTPTPTLNATQRQAADVVTRFYDVSDQVAANADVPLNALNEVAAGSLVEERLKLFQQYRVAGVRQVGRTKVLDVRSVEGTVGTFVVSACVDHGATDYVDSAGKSISAPESPPRVLHRFQIREVGGSLRAVLDEAVATC